MLQLDAHYAQQPSVPEHIFQLYDVLKSGFENRKSWQEMSEVEVWHELCLCILSSNVPYELAKSCVLHLGQVGFLDTEWILKSHTARRSIGNELSKSIYLPRKKDGCYRKYRFPRVRAQNIVGAARVVYRSHGGIKAMLFSSGAHEKLRNMMAECIPGLGLKESSHFLRNIGYSSNLAIIDVHIISFLQFLGLIPNTRIAVNPRSYFQLEAIMQQISRQYQLDLAILDNAIWHYMRNKCDNC